MTKPTKTDLRLRTAKPQGAAPTMREQCRMNAADAVRWQAAHMLAGRRKWLTSSQTKLDKFDGVNVGLTMSPAREALPYLAELDDIGRAIIRTKAERQRPDLRELLTEVLCGEGLGTISKRWTACPRATAACTLACVGRGGQGRLQSSHIARIGKTLAWHVAPRLALVGVAREVARKVRPKAPQDVWLRANVATDGPGRAADIVTLARAMLAADGRADPAHVRGYDYTAIPEALARRDGITRCLSYKGTRRSAAECRDVLANGGRVAVVFDIGADDPKPDTWHGYTVRDGDYHDVWPLFTGPGEVVGLYLKGHPHEKAKARRSGFAVDPEVTP